MAVSGGALVALISLVQHAPAWVAVLRGAVVYFIVRKVGRWGLTALEQSLAADRAETVDETEESS